MLFIVSLPGRSLAGEVATILMPLVPDRALSQMIAHTARCSQALLRSERRLRARRAVQCRFRALPDHPFRVSRPTERDCPQKRRPRGRKAEEVGHALRVFGDGPFVALPGSERSRHVDVALEI